MKTTTFYEADGSVYLTRWTLLNMGRLGRIALHRFHRPDADPELHDHPWSFLSLVVKGSYVEELGGCRFAVRRGFLSLAYRQAAIPHRVAAMSAGGCWTLLWISGKHRGREWGFYTDKGWEPWGRFPAQRQSNNGEHGP